MNDIIFESLEVKKLSPFDVQCLLSVMITLQADASMRRIVCIDGHTVAWWWFVQDKDTYYIAFRAFKD